MTKHEFVVIKGEEEYEEFKYEDLRLYVLKSALWVVCRGGAGDAKVRELHELDSVAEGTPVTIELSKEFLETCRNERIVEELDYMMEVYELCDYLESGLTSEEYFEKYYKDAVKQIRKNLIRRLLGFKENSIRPLNADIVAERLLRCLFASED